MAEISAGFIGAGTAFAAAKVATSAGFTGRHESSHRAELAEMDRNFHRYRSASQDSGSDISFHDEDAFRGKLNTYARFFYVPFTLRIYITHVFKIAGEPKRILQEPQQIQGRIVVPPARQGQEAGKFGSLRGLLETRIMTCARVLTCVGILHWCCNSFIAGNIPSIVRAWVGCSLGLCRIRLSSRLGIGTGAY
jgi:hypothetical protein